MNKATALCATATASLATVIALACPAAAVGSEDQSQTIQTMSLVAAATAKATKAAALTPDSAARLRPALGMGASSPAVIYVQRKLGVRPVSGYYGPITKAAVKSLQAKFKLARTGRMNSKTWAALARSKSASRSAAKAAKKTVKVLTPAEAAAKRPELKFGMGPDNPAVIFVQQYLNVSPQSGYFGAMTREAVLAYQRGVGLSATGVVGPLTWQAIEAKKVADPAKAAASAPADPEAPTLSADGAATTVATTPAPATIPTPTYTLPENPTAADKALVYALAQVGKPYVLGGNGPDVFDCSGLVQQAYLSAGISLPRLASQQQYEGTQVTLETLVPGDLIYYQDGASPRRGHISMYAGNGLAVEAANPRRGVRIRALNESWYAERFVRATHIS